MTGTVYVRTDVNRKNANRFHATGASGKMGSIVFVTARHKAPLALPPSSQPMMLTPFRARAASP